MWHIYVYTYTYIYIYIRLGVPRSFQAPSVLSRYYKRCYGIEMGGGGGVITSSGVRWIESCGNLEDVASLKLLLRCKYRWFTEGGWGGLGGGVITSCGVRWGCCYNEDVTALRMLLRWGSCYVEDVVMVRILLRWGSFCGEDLATLLRWGCGYLEDLPWEVVGTDMFCAFCYL